MSDFGERLKELMAERGLNTTDMEKATGIPNSRISEWIRYTISPYLESLIKISNFFNVSIDYLIGLTEEKHFDKARDEILFHHRLMGLLEENHMSFYRLAQSIGIDRSSFTHWQKGALPTMYPLIEMSKLFSCTIEYLIGRED